MRTFASLATPTTSQGGTVVAPRHQPADGVSVGPEAPGHRFADDDRGLGVGPVAVVEVTSTEHLDARRLEGPGVDLRPVCDEGAVARRRLEPGHVEVAAARVERVQVQIAAGRGARPAALTEWRLFAGVLLCIRCDREIDVDDLEPWRRASIIRGVQRRQGTPATAVLNRQITEAQEGAA